MATRDGYVVGQVASLVTQAHSTKKKAQRKNEKLAALFTAKPQKTSQREITPAEESGGYCPPPGIVHEAIKDEPVKTSKKRKLKEDEKTDEAREMTLLKRRRRDRRDKTNDDRTVFVGNLPTSITRKALKKLFGSFGDIETVRLRCAPRADLKMPKKLSIIKKEFHAERHNLAAYILFRSAEDTQKATAMNGRVVEGLHIRVDLANKDKQHDHQRSVFVGNLPFDANEEDVWKHFQDYGDVENVRLIRDRNTSIGKGFGYVLFKDKSSVPLTLKFNKHQFKGRQLRVQRSSARPVKSLSNEKRKGNSKATLEDEKATVKPKFKKPSNFSSHSFQGEKASSKKLTKKPRHKPRQSLTKNNRVENTSLNSKPKSKGSSTPLNLSRKKHLAMKAPGQKANHKIFS